MKQFLMILLWEQYRTIYSTGICLSWRVTLMVLNWITWLEYSSGKRPEMVEISKCCIYSNHQHIKNNTNTPAMAKRRLAGVLSFESVCPRVQNHKIWCFRRSGQPYELFESLLLPTHGSWKGWRFIDAALQPKF